MSRRVVIVVVLVVLAVAGFTFMTGKGTSWFNASSGPKLEIDEDALTQMSGSGNEFYVRSGRAG